MSEKRPIFAVIGPGMSGVTADENEALEWLRNNPKAELFLAQWALDIPAYRMRATAIVDEVIQSQPRRFAPIVRDGADDRLLCSVCGDIFDEGEPTMTCGRSCNEIMHHGCKGGHTCKVD